jgi:Na+-driven multidrug efflux pump
MHAVWLLFQVGNALGAKKKQLAIEMSRISLGVMLAVEVAVIAPLIMWLGPSFVAVFTRDPEVLALSRESVHLLVLLVVGDGMQGVASGVMRGAGRQVAGAVTNVMSYYCLGLPMAWLLCFRLQHGVGGLLFGIFLGALTQCIVLVSLIFGCETWVFQPAAGDTAAAADNEGEEVAAKDDDMNSYDDDIESDSKLTTAEIELVKLLENEGFLR